MRSAVGRGIALCRERAQRRIENPCLIVFTENNPGKQRSGKE
jgi:hypothetical protein